MSNIKTNFTSRFRNGTILEADWSQLEVWALAILSSDVALLNDLKDGIDTHARAASEWLKKPVPDVTKAERTLAKGIKFLVQYGGGAGGIVKKFKGVTIEEARQFIYADQKRYPRTYEYRHAKEGTLNNNKTTSTLKTPNGFPRSLSFLTNPITQRRIHFLSYDTPPWKREKTKEITSWSPTEIANLDIQGFAHEIVACTRIAFLREYKKFIFKEKVLPINTVHDNIVVDSSSDTIEEATLLLKNSFNKTGKVFKEYFNFQLPEIPFEITCGPSWGEQQLIYTSKKG